MDDNDYSRLTRDGSDSQRCAADRRCFRRAYAHHHARSVSRHNDIWHHQRDPGGCPYSRAKDALQRRQCHPRPRLAARSHPPPRFGHSGHQCAGTSHHDFAQPGDSGSVVFDGDGNIVGMVGGGVTRPGVLLECCSFHHGLKLTSEQLNNCMLCIMSIDYDITFVNPMDAILRDIRKVTGRKPSLTLKPRVKKRRLEGRDGS